VLSDTERTQLVEGIRAALFERREVAARSGDEESLREFSKVADVCQLPELRYRSEHEPPAADVATLFDLVVQRGGTPMDAVPERLRAVPANNEFLTSVRGGDVHSDLFDEMMLAAAGLPGVNTWHIGRGYSSVALYSDAGVIFAYASGMQFVGLRIPPERLDEALREGGERFTVAGPSWVSFHAFSLPIDAARERLKKWCAVARASAS
jgi:hypothetical protein